MNGGPRAGAGWYEGLDPGDVEGAVAAVTEGEAPGSADWPTLAVDAGFAGNEDEYYDLLREATMAATRAAVTERERAGDAQLVHAVRAMDNRRRILT